MDNRLQKMTSASLRRRSPRPGAVAPVRRDGGHAGGRQRGLPLTVASPATATSAWPARADGGQRRAWETAPSRGDQRGAEWHGGDLRGAIHPLSRLRVPWPAQTGPSSYLADGLSLDPDFGTFLVLTP